MHNIKIFFFVSIIVASVAGAANLVTHQDVTAGQWINWVAISHDGNVAAAATYKPNQKDDYEFFLFSNKGEITFKDRFENFLGGAFWVALSSNGDMAAVGGLKKKSEDDEVGFVRAYLKHQIVLDQETEGRVNALALSADGQTLIVGAGRRHGESEVLSLFQMTTRGFLKIDSLQRTSGCRSVAYSDAGDVVVCGRFDGVVEAFRIRDAKLQPLLEYQLQPGIDHLSVRFVNISPDGRWIVTSGNNGYFYLFDTQNPSPQPLWTKAAIGGHEVYGVAISSNGRFIAAGSSDGVNDGNGKNRLQIVENVCANEKCSPYDYWSFTPDRPPNPGMMFDGSGRWLTLATGFPVGTASSFYLFDIQNKKLEFRQPTSDMNWPLAISRDGKFLVGGSDESRVYFFQNERAN